MRQKIILFSFVAIFIICIGYVLNRSKPKHYSRTPSEAMQNLSIAIYTNDENRIASLFASDEAFNNFMRVPIDSAASKTSKTPLSRHKGQSSFAAWNRWFKKYGLSALHFEPSVDGKGIVCTTADNMNFMIFMKKYAQGYLITGCTYEM